MIIAFIILCLAIAFWILYGAYAEGKDVGYQRAKNELLGQYQLETNPDTRDALSYAHKCLEDNENP